VSSAERFYAAACQLDLPNPAHRDEIAGRVDRMLEMIEHAVIGYEPFFDVRLVVFPEFAHAAPIYPAGQADRGPITPELNEASIRRGCKALRRASRDRP